MWATLYRPLSEKYPTFQSAKLTDIFKIISYDYTKRFTTVGEFTMEIPINEPAVPYIARDTVLITNDGDDLYITDTEETATRFVIKGYDLKVLLALRLTLFPPQEQDTGAYGYFVVKGSTEYCLKEIVKYNISGSDNPDRQIYGFTVAKNQNRGLADDKYMTRLEALDTVAAALCDNAKIGWDITADTVFDRYIFDVVVPVDRSDNQKEVSKVVFSEQFLNVTELTRQQGVSSLKNAIYAVNSQGVENAYVQLVNRDEDPAAGVLRKETVVNINCEYEEVQSYALREVEDKIEVDSLEMEVQAVDSYKKDWFIGDIVTFRHDNLLLNSSIIEVNVSRSGDSYRVKLKAGDTVPTAIESLSNSANKNNRDNNNLVLAGTAGASVFYGVGNGDVNIRSMQNTVAIVQFAAAKSCIPLFSVTIPYTITAPGVVTFTLVYDGLALNTYSETVSVGIHFQTFTMPLLSTSNGGHTATVLVSSADAVGIVDAKNTYATVFGSGLAAAAAWDGTITARDTFTPITLTLLGGISLADDIHINHTERVWTPLRTVHAEKLKPIELTADDIELAEIDENVDMLVEDIPHAICAETVTGIELDTPKIELGVLNDTVIIQEDENA